MDLLFATLTPTNDIAKMAFSDAYDAIARGHQGTSADTGVHCMRVASEQEYHSDVLLFRREIDRKLSEGDFSESPTEPDTDTEVASRHLGMIWKGHYVLGFQHHPSAPNLGWVVGKRVVERGPYADLFLRTGAFAKRYGLNLRSFHARFNFDLENGAFFIARITSSPSAGLAVNGEVVGRRIYVLNQHCMKIRVNSLEYNFQYTNFASTEEFIKERKVYLNRTLRAPSAIFDMPTPHRNTRPIGQWTLNDPLGKGSAGRVFLASNSKNQVVAIKIMEYTSKSAGVVDMEIARCRELTALAQKKDDGGHLVQLKEMVVPRQEVLSSSTAFEEVALVLEPVTPYTLDDLVRNWSMGERGSRGMSIDTAFIFRDVLRGLEFLHDNGWVHCDMKPQNVGVLPGSPPRAVLLDMGQAAMLECGSMLPAKPGYGGTVNYLAPEREMSEYDHAVDIWPMGVTGFELTYGHHPFKFASNPWRPGEEYERMRPAFHQKYLQAIDRLSNDYRQYTDQKVANKNLHFIHLGGVLIEMLRHAWAESSGDCARRIKVNEALQHPAWAPLLSDKPETKRARFDEETKTASSPRK